MPENLTPRRLILLAGAQHQGKKAALALIARSKLRKEQALWLKPEDKTPGLLGQEHALVVMDTYLGLNPDVFGRVSGLVQAGGALLLICPTIEDWPEYDDPEMRKLIPYPQASNAINGFYLNRWVRILRSLRGIEHYHSDNDSVIPALEIRQPDTPLSRACTPDQQQAVDAVISTVRGQRRRPAIISADRGRGKSAALGLASGQLLASQQVQNIILTASSFNQVGSVFKHAQAVLPDACMLNGQKFLNHAHGTLRYIATDSLIETPRDCDLLIVDEASTLGVARLKALLERYSRIVFSGTEQGYEGSGRGFSLKFRQLIEAQCRGQYAVKLETPVRWAINDPLEYWTNRLLLLDSKQGQEQPPTQIQLGELSFREIAQSTLAANENLLINVVGLLVNAHYQTRPVDCRYLLDAPNSRLFVVEHKNNVIALTWLMLEGGLETNIARKIVAGQRRPQGHLVPQILAAHLGLDAAITQRCARIQRIAVHPVLQGQGIGHWMLAQLEKQVSETVDYLASSFGADLPLSRFWRHAGFHAARVSDKPQAASGLHSVVMLKPCRQVVMPLSLQVDKLFRTQFIHQLADGLGQFPPGLGYHLAASDSAELNLSTQELKAAVLFAWAQRPYESSLAVLAKIGQYALLRTNPGLEPGSTAHYLLIKRVLQNQPWSVCSKELGIQGKKECVKHLRQGLRNILAQAGPEKEITLLRTQYHC